jgi:hypothetical protein
LRGQGVEYSGKDEVPYECGEASRSFSTGEPDRYADSEYDREIREYRIPRSRHPWQPQQIVLAQP